MIYKNKSQKIKILLNNKMNKLKSMKEKLKNLQ